MAGTSGQEDDDHAIGIDLGTSYCRVVMWRRGHVEAIIEDEHGRFNILACVAFTDTNKLIGHVAKDKVETNPTGTVFNVKRLIGRQFNDPSVRSDKKFWPFKLSKGPGEKPIINLAHNGEAEQYSAEKISSMLLDRMKKIAENCLQAGKSTLKHAVISVPACFSDSQRRATLEAAHLSGLNVLRLINDSTADAIAYSMIHKKLWGSTSEKMNVLMFDLGGGALDVSLVTLEGNDFVVKSVTGDTHLGGEDFNNRLVDHLIQELQVKHKIEISYADTHAVQTLRMLAEKIKLELSERDLLRFEIDYQGTIIHTQVSRKEFEEMNMDLFRKCMELVERCLTDAKIDKGQVCDVGVFGGSTRIPKLRALLKDFFDTQKFYFLYNFPVAYGAAVQAGALRTSSQEVPVLSIHDITPCSIGMKNVNGLMRRIIPRYTTIPTKLHQMFTTHSDNQQGLEIQLYEGDEKFARDNRKLFTVEISDLPTALKGEPRIGVSFQLDANGILSADAKLQEAREEEFVFIMDEEGRVIKLVTKPATTTNALQRFLNITAQTMKTEVYATHVSEGEKVQIGDAFDDGMLYMKNLDADIHEFEDKKRELEAICNPILSRLTDFLPVDSSRTGSGRQLQPNMEEVD